MHDDEDFTISSENLYADFGFREPEIALAKAALARRLTAIIKERGLTQTVASDVLGIGQPKVSAIMRGRLKEFSLDRLAQLLTRFNQDVEIIVAPAGENRSTGRVFVHEDEAAIQEPSLVAASRRVG